MHDPKSLLDERELAKEMKIERDRARAHAEAHCNPFEKIFGDRAQPKYKARKLAPLCDWTSDKAKMARASRPLQNHEQALKESMNTTLMGKKDPTVPAVNSFAEWFSA